MFNAYIGISIINVCAFIRIAMSVASTLSLSAFGVFG